MPKRYKSNKYVQKKIKIFDKKSNKYVQIRNPNKC